MKSWTTRSRKSQPKKPCVVRVRGDRSRGQAPNRCAFCLRKLRPTHQ